MMTEKEKIVMLSIRREIEVLKIKGRRFEYLVKYSDDQPRGPDGRWASGGSGTGGDLTNTQESVRLDSNGVPFNYPNVYLPPKEYKNFTDQVGRTWHSKYKGKELCRYTTTKKTYYFENRGIGDYNIYRVKEHKK